MVTNTDPDTSFNDDSESDESADFESKSQRKRAARQITALAAELVEMKPKVLASLPLEPTVREAISQCSEIKAHGARKRQLHFVSKLLRETGNIDDIVKIVNRPDLQKSSSSANPHQSFRDKLLEDLGENVEQLRNDYPSADLQQIRQLVRNAHNEHKKANQQKDDDSDREIEINSTKSAKSLLKLLAASQ